MDHTETQRSQRKTDFKVFWWMNENEIGTIVVDSAVGLHKELGPGLLETVYEVILFRMLREAGLKVDRQIPVPIEFR